MARGYGIDPSRNWLIVPVRHADMPHLSEAKSGRGEAFRAIQSLLGLTHVTSTKWLTRISAAVQRRTALWPSSIHKCFHHAMSMDYLGGVHLGEVAGDDEALDLRGSLVCERQRLSHCGPLTELKDLGVTEKLLHRSLRVETNTTKD